MGILLCGIQLSLSSGMSGSIMNAARTEIFLGKAKDDDDNTIRSDSDYGVSA